MGSTLTFDRSSDDLQGSTGELEGPRMSRGEVEGSKGSSGTARGSHDGVNA